MTTFRTRGLSRRRNRWSAALVAAVLLALFVSARRHAIVRRITGDFAAEAESLNAAMRRHDWSSATQWSERLATERPRNFAVIYDLALSLHNRAFSQPRPVLRTSLERIATESRAMALLDSAARLAPTPAERAHAELLHGMAFENLGLPIDALEAYRAAHDHDPKLELAAQRYRWVRAHLFQPQLHDTMTDAELDRYAR